MQLAAFTSFSIATSTEGRLRANEVDALERMNRQRAEHHGRNEREGTIERSRVEPRSGPPGQRARIKVQAGFRR